MTTQDEWKQQRRQTRDLLRRLPRAIQHELGKVRRDDLRADLVGRVLDRVSERACALGLSHQPHEEAEYREPRLTAVEERQLLRTMVTPEFIGWLRREVGQCLRTAHLSKIDPGQCSSLPDSLSFQSPPGDSLWIPDEDLGLGVASALDGPPEAWWACCAQEILRISNKNFEGGQSPDLCVLALDAGAGGLARALSVVPTMGEVLVRETGPVLGHTELPIVLGSSARGDNAGSSGQGVQARISKYARTDPIPNRCFDVIVWSAPSPAVGGASNEVLPYLNPVYIGNRLTYPSWLGRVGPNRWRQQVRRIINIVAKTLIPQGTAIIRLPLGYRISEKPKRGNQARHGYIEKLNLLDGIPEYLSQAGLKVATTIEERPEGLVSQPFVGKSRCTWVTYVLVKEATQ